MTKDEKSMWMWIGGAALVFVVLPVTIKVVRFVMECITAHTYMYGG
jgi:hypothetical protein